MKIINSIYITIAAVTLLACSVAVQAASMDSRIEDTARQSYVFKTYLNGDDIKIQAKDGAVTLTGTVMQDSHISLAQETVAGLPGVRSVNNKLEVKGEVPSKDSDAWLITKVKSALLFHRSVSAGATEVNVKNGIVTLRGTADSQAQKDLTTEYARDVEGVKAVYNDMTVAKAPGSKQTIGENIDDASITAQVKMSLLYHRSTSAIKTKVETMNGVVTLQGKAANRAEMELASRYAGDIYGVKSVTNLMTIE